MTKAAESIADLVRRPEAVGRFTPTTVFCHRVPTLPRWFVGRDDIVGQLVGRATGGRSVLTHTVDGRGGVGKTTIAAAVAEAGREHLDVVWWVRSEEPGTLAADLAELGPLVGVAVDEGDVPGSAERVLRWLETTDRPWLVVYDNVPDEASMAGRLPARGTGQVLITSLPLALEQAASWVTRGHVDRRSRIGPGRPPRLLAHRPQQDDDRCAPRRPACRPEECRAGGRRVR